MQKLHASRRRVLIADDDEDSRILLSFLLEEEGWEVTQACNGQEALTKVIAEKPDLLILDNRMPELTGVEVYQYLKAQNIDLPIVLATAHGSLEELALKFGIAYFVQKPYDFPNLIQTIESAYRAYL